MFLPGLFDLLDIVLVASVLWLAYRSLQRTRARNAVVGLAVLPALFLVARALELRLMASLLQGFFAVAVLILVVVFQEDLRRFFEEIGNWRRDRPSPTTAVSDTLIRTLARLMASRTGALIVIPGRDPLEGHLTGGIALGGRASEPLLLSLFDSSSPGHDGAVVIRGGTIERFAAHLPLSANHAALGPGGTRHAAALGLSERCDATVIVVSEERGTVSLARNGTLRALPGPEALVDELTSEVSTPVEPVPLHRRRAVREVAVALAAAAGLWMFVVPGAEIVESELEVPIVVTNLPADLRLLASDPPHVTVQVRGRRRELLLAERAGASLRIDAYLARFGRRSFALESANLQGLGAVDVLEVLPDRVVIDLEQIEAPPATTGGNAAGASNGGAAATGAP